MARLSLILLGLLAFLSLSLPAKGNDPSYRECQPHIDATIRNLAAKAVHAGEVPSEEEVKEFVTSLEPDVEDEQGEEEERVEIAIEEEEEEREESPAPIPEPKPLEKKREESPVPLPEPEPQENKKQLKDESKSNAIVRQGKDMLDHVAQFKDTEESKSKKRADETTEKPNTNKFSHKTHSLQNDKNERRQKEDKKALRKDYKVKKSDKECKIKYYNRNIDQIKNKLDRKKMPIQESKLKIEKQKHKTEEEKKDIKTKDVKFIKTLNAKEGRWKEEKEKYIKKEKERYEQTKEKYKKNDRKLPADELEQNREKPKFNEKNHESRKDFNIKDKRIEQDRKETKDNAHKEKKKKERYHSEKKVKYEEELKKREQKIGPQKPPNDVKNEKLQQENENGSKEEFKPRETNIKTQLEAKEKSKVIEKNDEKRKEVNRKEKRIHEDRKETEDNENNQKERYHSVKRVEHEEESKKREQKIDPQKPPNEVKNEKLQQENEKGSKEEFKPRETKIEAQKEMKDQKHETGKGEGSEEEFKPTETNIRTQTEAKGAKEISKVIEIRINTKEKRKEGDKKESVSKREAKGNTHKGKKDEQKEKYHSENKVENIEELKRRDSKKESQKSLKDVKEEKLHQEKKKESKVELKQEETKINKQTETEDDKEEKQRSEKKEELKVRLKTKDSNVNPNKRLKPPTHLNEKEEIKTKKNQRSEKIPKPGGRIKKIAPEVVKPEEIPSTPTTEKQTKEVQKFGLWDKFIDFTFGYPKGERDPKYSTPWMTHPEFKKQQTAKSEEKKKVGPKPYNSGFIGGMINSMVSSIFGLPKGPRDPKYNEPWQTHPEFKREKEPKEVSKPKVPQHSSFQFISNGINSMVEMIFGKVTTVRDPKYAQPWQTHQEHVKKVKSAPEELVKKKKEMGCLPGGNLLNKLISLVFPMPTGPRDPRWSQPWQTHKEHIKPKKNIDDKPKVKAGPGIFSEMVNKFVYSIFGKLDKPRDEKWKQPWQQHPEFAKRSQPSEEPKTVKKPAGPGFLSRGINSFVEFIFGKTSTVRDAKWAEPWQTHEPKKGTPQGLSKKSQPSPPPREAPTPSPPREELTKRVAPSPSKEEELKRTAPPPIKPEPKKAHSPPPSQRSPSPPPKARSPSPPAKARSPSPPPKDRSPSPPPKARSPSPPPKARSPTRERSLSPETPKHREPPREVPKPKEEVVKEAFHSDTPSGARRSPERQSPLPADRVADAPKAKEEQVLEEKTQKSKPKIIDDEDEQVVLIPSAFRSREHIDSILGLDEISRLTSERTEPIAEGTLKDLKLIYDSAIKPLETLYKYQDISYRHLSDAEIFGRPLILLMGPYSTGKSTFINYLLGIEFTKRALKTGTPPSHGVFRVIQYGTQDRDLDGTHLSGQGSFSTLQKYGQNFIDQLHGKALDVPLLKKVTFVEAPGILEMRRSGERLYPLNDVIQWFIDRADLILVMFDYTKLDAGYEMEAVLDQLKGREVQTRILLNKADQVPPEELIKVQGSLFWNLSPLLGVSSPPTVYAGSFASRPYRTSSPAKLFQAQEEALLHDIAKAMNARVDNRIAIARRHAVRVRNHAQMVDTYLQTFYSNKGFLTSKHKLAEEIVNNPHAYNIYEGVSLLTNISRYDLPDSDVYREFFRIHNLYDFKTLRETCTYIGGCPLEKIDAAISEKLPQLVVKYKRKVEAAALASPLPDTKKVNSPNTDARMAHVHTRTL